MTPPKPPELPLPDIEKYEMPEQSRQSIINWYFNNLPEIHLAVAQYNAPTEREMTGDVGKIKSAAIAAYRAAELDNNTHNTIMWAIDFALSRYAAMSKADAGESK